MWYKTISVISLSTKIAVRSTEVDDTMLSWDYRAFLDDDRPPERPKKLVVVRIRSGSLLRTHPDMYSWSSVLLHVYSDMYVKDPVLFMTM